MSCLPRPLLATLALSLLIHAAPFIDEWISPPQAAHPKSVPSMPITATLIPVAPASPALILDEAPSHPEKKGTPEVKKPEKQAIPKATEIKTNFPVDRKNQAKTWTQTIQEQFSAQQREGLFYPEAAIDQGLEGEALVLLMLDQNGAVVAARIEQSSGHPLLDQAALRAVRRLHSLPADAPSESLLPVRFRLR